MMKIELRNWEAARDEAQRIRFTVFVEEQRVPPEREMDEHDPHCLHALAYWTDAADGRPIGTGRLLPDGHIGRMAVLKEWRGRGAGRALLRALVEAARQRGDQEVALNAQVQALGFYRAEGFEPEGPVYQEAGIDHQVMRRRLDQGDRMRIGIIGSGGMGQTLARRLAKLGHRVSIANSRGPKSLAALAAETGATPVAVVDAAKAGEIVFIAIPTKAVIDLPRGLFAKMAESVVVIDIGNYHPELRDGRIDAIDRGMTDSQWVAQQLGRPVIKAFNNIFAKSLLEKGVARGTPGRIALSVAGDSLDAKAAVLRLADDLGFDPVDGGDLGNSWRQQPGTPAYCRDLEAAALRRALAEADRSRIAEYRAGEEARIRKHLNI